MYFRTAGAERTGEGESPIWIPRWIEEKANGARTADGEKNGGLKSSVWTAGGTGDRANGASGSVGFSGEEDSALSYTVKELFFDG